MDLGRAVGLHVVAEGIEEQHELRALRDIENVGTARASCSVGHKQRP